MKNQEILQLIYGPPHVDGYGSQVITLTDGSVQEVALGANSMYTIQWRFNDGYLGIIDGYEFDASTPAEGPFGDESESSITDANGFFMAADSEKVVMTNDKRKVLSLKQPDGVSVHSEVRIIKHDKGGFLYGKHRK